ncbi:hypothetical protein E2542_SST26380 [Spatholobus suberectus]|nr:hypothetical protein E2542_SST26380 [Spatholobus suberectus]
MLLIIVFGFAQLRFPPSRFVHHLEAVWFSNQTRECALVNYFKIHKGSTIDIVLRCAPKPSAFTVSPASRRFPFCCSEIIMKIGSPKFVYKFPLCSPPCLDSTTVL